MWWEDRMSRNTTGVHPGEQLGKLFLVIARAREVALSNTDDACKELFVSITPWYIVLELERFTR